ncbi:PD-(D/E)XK nuclease domain-containing protein [Haliscomenobacter hydrossis]|uniref:PD-(D/E)XK nuclease domain-containing protein n=1 Tax=Haliscomenobacter hydrossis TaxID=2350 RepID=UPI0006945AEE|nr:PD-(D/E)XK nuclease domain-containing protein [Haliscomenobacter hydrossis]
MERYFVLNGLLDVLNDMEQGISGMWNLSWGYKTFEASLKADTSTTLVETETYLSILEYKLDESVQVALDQIKQKKYCQAYWEKGKKVIGVGVNFSSQTRNIEAWVAQELG